MKSRRLKIEDYGNYHFVIDLFTLRDAWFPCVFLADSFNHSHGFLVQRGMQAAQEFANRLAYYSDGELEVVEKSNLDDHAFKEKIIAALKEESYA